MGDDFVQDPDYVHTDNNLTDELVEKIEESGNEPLVIYENRDGGEYTEHNIEVYNQLVEYLDSPDGKSSPVVVFIDSNKKPHIVAACEYASYKDKDVNFYFFNNYYTSCAGGIRSDGTASNFCAVRMAEYREIKNSTITIKQGDNEQSFSLNQDSNQTIEIEEGQPHWFGTKAEFDALEEKDPNTIYFIGD